MADVVWKPVKDWPAYFVSAAGQLKGPRGHLLAGYRDKNGYHCAYIGPRKAGKAIKVHRAVVEAFIGPIPNGMQVNHKNGVKDDNRVENLEIVTPSGNILHSFRALGREPSRYEHANGEKHHNAKLTEQQVRQIRRLYAEGRTQTSLASQFDTKQNHISRIVRRESWAHLTD